MAAQGFGADRTDPTISHFRQAASRLGAVQIDSVNVVTRTHYLPLYSRLGAYPRDWLEAEAWGPKRSLFEYWGHEASLLPVESQPLFRWRMARAEAGQGNWGGVARFGHERRDYIDGILREIEQRGPVTGGDFATGPRGAPGWWSWSDGKRALEWLFWSGKITTLTRRGFERVYDLPERALPRGVVEASTPSEPDAQRDLMRIAARALGVATAGDLRDYPPTSGRRQGQTHRTGRGGRTDFRHSRKLGKTGLPRFGGPKASQDGPHGPAVALRQPDLVP